MLTANWAEFYARLIECNTCNNVGALAIGPYCWIEGLMKMILFSVCVMIGKRTGLVGR